MNGFVITYILLYVIGFFFGRMSAKNIIFGVTIQDEHLEDERFHDFKVFYTKTYGIVVGILMVCLVYFEFKSHSQWYLMIFVALWLLVSMALFVYLNSRTKKVKMELMNNADRSYTLESEPLFDNSEEMPMIKSYFSVAFLIVFLTILLTIVNYGDINDQIPMRYDSKGVVINYADKSMGSVFSMVFMQLFLTVVLYGSTYISIKYSKVKLNPRKPLTSELQYKIAMKRFSVMMAITATVLNITFLMIQMTIIGFIEFNQVILFGITFIPIFLIAFSIGWFFVTTGMTGEKLKLNIDEKELDVDIPDSDDEGWKWGIFYYNKKDSSIFVPKRFGGGFTINFGNPWGILILVGILSFIILSVVFSLNLSK